MPAGTIASAGVASSGVVTLTRKCVAASANGTKTFDPVRTQCRSFCVSVVQVAATPFQEVSGFRSAGIRIMLPSAIAVSAASRRSDGWQHAAGTAAIALEASSGLGTAPRPSSSKISATLSGSRSRPPNAVGTNAPVQPASRKCANQPGSQVWPSLA